MNLKNEVCPNNDSGASKNSNDNAQKKLILGDVSLKCMTIPGFTKKILPSREKDVRDNSLPLKQEKRKFLNSCYISYILAHTYILQYTIIRRCHGSFLQPIVATYKD